MKEKWKNFMGFMRIGIFITAALNTRQVTAGAVPSLKSMSLKDGDLQVRLQYHLYKLKAFLHSFGVLPQISIQFCEKIFLHKIV